MSMDKKNFIKDLKALLKTYNASINFTCADCSDTYGIYEAGMSINIDGKQIKKTDGWRLDATDL